MHVLEKLIAYGALPITVSGIYRVVHLLEFSVPFGGIIAKQAIL